MVVLNRIYTKTGDRGTTALGTGERVNKSHLRIQAYGTVDETNAVIGVVRLYTDSSEWAELDWMLGLIQNDLFDLGADLCTPEKSLAPDQSALRIVPDQAARLERQIDELNETLAPLRSFVLPGGHPAAAHLHVARTVCRRAERAMVALKEAPGETVSDFALIYVNRLSDFLFVASRWVNAQGKGDVLWQPGKSRDTP